MASRESWIADLLNENHDKDEDFNLDEVIADYFGERKDDASSDDDEGMV